MKSKFRAQTEGTTIQSLPHMWPIYIQPPKLDKMDEAKKCMLTGTGYRSLLRDTARTCQIQKWMLLANHWTEKGTPIGRIREKDWKSRRGFQPHKNNHANQQELKNPRQSLKWKPWWGIAFIGLLLVVRSTCFLIPPLTTCPMIKLFTEHWNAQPKHKWSTWPTDPSIG